MNDLNQLLTLPLPTLVVLVSGYIGYRLSYTGLDKSHTTLDALLLSLSFGLVAKLFLLTIKTCDFGAVIQSCMAIFFVIAIASLWRKWGITLMGTTLRLLNISISDGQPTAWDTIGPSTKYAPNQLTVRKTDGSAVMCEILDAYKDLPHGPCLLGQDGSVALYVTHFRKSDENGAQSWQEISPLDEKTGALITYIPASKIDEIEIRHQI